MEPGYRGGGKLVTPFLSDRAYREPSSMPVSREKLEIVQKGLDYVVRKGTGARAGKFGVTIAGKTGTAQNAHGDDHALFAGYAPAEDPRYVAVAVIEAGKHGSSVASPIVGEILAHILSHPSAEGEGQGN